jgi:hypothetical protein
MDNIERGIKIVGGIANIAITVDKFFNKKQLAILLNLFDQKTSEGKKYKEPSGLIEKAINHYSSIGETTTVDNIKTAYKGIDLTLLK